MLTTILFDLDGTLLPVDTDTFVHHYIGSLAEFMAPHIPPRLLAQQLLASTAVMIGNSDRLVTNARAFADDFFPKVGREEGELTPHFEEFYRVRFPELQRVCGTLPGIGREVVQTAVERGFSIALVTNPLFPRAAIEERMRWARLSDLPWRLVTSYEEMHACKPRAEYYQEVLDRLGAAPQECLMVGNDADEDGAAALVGIPVFIVTDYLVNRSGRSLPAESSGTLREFLKRLQSGL